MAIQDTIQGSFRGVPFYVRTETQEGGRKIAVHEYPGSDKRFIEDLGNIPPVFRIIAFVSGSDWRSQANRLAGALSKDTEGLLNLTTFGTVRVKATKYTRIVSQTSLGEVSFSISFMVTDQNISVNKVTSSPKNVVHKAANVLIVVQKDMADRLEPPKEVLAAKVMEYDGAVQTQTIADKIRSLGADIDTISDKVNGIRNNIGDLVRDPVAYAAEVFNDGLLGEVFDTVSASRDAMLAFSELSRLGSNLATDFETIGSDLLDGIKNSFDIPLFEYNTNYRVASNSNRTALTSGMRTSILALYLKTAVDVEYPTDDDINDTIADIDDIYTNVVMTDNISPDVALALDQCRIEALSVLEDKLQNTPNVELYDLKVPTIDLEVAYRLYAESIKDEQDLIDSAVMLTDLNDILPNRYKDTIKVLRA